MREVKGLGGYGIKGLRKTILNAGFLILDCRGDCSRQGRQGRKAPTRVGAQTRIAKDVSILCRKPECL